MRLVQVANVYEEEDTNARESSLKIVKTRV